MMRALCISVALGLLGFVSCDQATAADAAATNELPAALSAMGIDSSQLVSEQEAAAVRGQGGALYWVSGAVMVQNNVANLIAYMDIDQPTIVNVIFTTQAFGLSFVSQ